MYAPDNPYKLASKRQCLSQDNAFNQSPSDIHGVWCYLEASYPCDCDRILASLLQTPTKRVDKTFRKPSIECIVDQAADMENHILDCSEHEAWAIRIRGVFLNSGLITSAVGKRKLVRLVVEAQSVKVEAWLVAGCTCGAANPAIWHGFEFKQQSPDCAIGII